jgi:hypothetical protein
VRDLLAKFGERLVPFLRTRLREGSSLRPVEADPRAIKTENFLEETARLQNPTKSEKLTKVISTAD